MGITRLQAHVPVNEHDTHRDFVQNSAFSHMVMCFWAGKYGTSNPVSATNRDFG